MLLRCTIDGSSISSFTGTASALKTSLAHLQSTPSSDSPVPITLDNAVTEASDITTLKNLEYISTVAGSAVTTINGSTTQIKAALEALTSKNANFSSTIDGEIVVSECKQLIMLPEGQSL